MKIKFKKLDPQAQIPSYAHKGDAGLDLKTIETKTIHPGTRQQFRTGLSFELQEGYVFLIKDKSGLAVNHGITTLAGVIEYTYRGEIIVILHNLSDKPKTFEKGDKVAQALIMPITTVEIEETETLSQTQRGEKGFGSTGR